jgi:zinc protease
LKQVAEATAEDLVTTARKWLSDGVYILEVHPFPDYSTTASTVDRSTLPEVGPAPEADFPELEHATLDNGLKVVLAHRAGVPLVNLTMLVDAGYAADQFAAPGTASLTMNMLDEGTETRSALEISEQLALLGANLGSGSSLDVSTVSLSALKENLNPSLALFADVILNPSFPESDFQRLQAQTLAGIQREKVQPVTMALRVLPRLLYGEGHAYSNPYTGTGTEASVKAMTRGDLAKFHETWFKPNNATLVVAGATTMAEIRPELESLFGAWEHGKVPDKNIDTVEPLDESVVYLIDRPGSDQSIIFAGNLAPPKANPDEMAIKAMNNILGGKFGSRINMNLREDKHWSYGAFTLLFEARGQRPFFAYAPVQTDKTSESMVEVKEELEGILGARPVTAEELATAKADLTLTLPGQWETINALEGSINEIVMYGLDDDYYDTYATRINNLGVADIVPAAEEVISPDHLVWVIVGDLSKIEEEVRALGFGEVRLLDADGRPVE